MGKEDECREEEEAQNNKAQMGQEKSLDYFAYGEDVDKHASTLIVSPGGRDSHNLDLPIAVDSSSDKKFPSVDQLYSMSQGEKIFKALLEELSLLVNLRQSPLLLQRELLVVY